MPENFSLIYEDESLFVINKTFNLHSVANQNSNNLSLADLLKEHNPALVNASPKPEDCGLVQRLDYQTSGCLLGAKNLSIWNKLHSSLLRGDFEKSYMALVAGLPEKEILLDNFIGSPYRRAKKQKVFKTMPARKERALPAHTRFKLLETNAELNCSLVEAAAHSARRHQVRAHAAFVGHPLIGDFLYNSQIKLADLYSTTETLPEFFLHAYQLSFLHPLKDERISFSAPVPSFVSELFPNLDI